MKKQKKTRVKVTNNGNKKNSPLFTERMYQNLGTQWASSIPAFLSLVCAPMPFLFYRYGKYLRGRSKLATEARAIMEQMLKKQAVPVVATAQAAGRDSSNDLGALEAQPHHGGGDESSNNGEKDGGVVKV